MCAPEFSDIEISIWQEYQDDGIQVVGISNEPIEVIQNFIADQGITFPILQDNAGVYGNYNIPGGQSPFPRDYIVDSHGVLLLSKTEYDPGEMINIIEGLLNDEVKTGPDANLQIPEAIKLLPNYPNPFNPATTLNFTLTTSSAISLDIVNLKARVVANLLTHQVLPSGSHDIRWQGIDDQGNPLPSGLYFVRLRTDNQFLTRKVMLIK